MPFCDPDFHEGSKAPPRGKQYTCIVGEALPSTYLRKESNPSPRPSNIGLLVGSAYLHEGSNPPPFSQYLIRCKRHLCIFIRDLVHHSQRTINGMRYESDMNLYICIRDQTRHPLEKKTPSEILKRSNPSPPLNNILNCLYISCFHKESNPQPPLNSTLKGAWTATYLRDWCQIIVI